MLIKASLEGKYTWSWEKYAQEEAYAQGICQSSHKHTHNTHTHTHTQEEFLMYAKFCKMILHPMQPMMNQMNPIRDES